MVPIAAFLAGALLSLLLPVLLLIALVVWYMVFLRRVPDTREPELPGTPASPRRDVPAEAGSGSGDL